MMTFHGHVIVFLLLPMFVVVSVSTEEAQSTIENGTVVTPETNAGNFALTPAPLVSNSTSDSSESSKENKDLTCPLPPNLEHGGYHNRTSTWITYVCHNGYRLKGNSSLSCVQGKWSELNATCELILCPPPPTVLNAAQPITSGLQFNSNVTYTCDDGFSLQGDMTLRCGINGTWEGTQPVCQIKDCSEPTSLTNGRYDLVNESTTYSSMARYYCNKGYMATDSFTTLTCQANRQWSTANITCKLIDCGEPMTLTNGHYDLVNRSTTYLSIAHYYCYHGYTATGSHNSRICQADEQWSGDISRCSLTAQPYGQQCYSEATAGACSTDRAVCSNVTGTLRCSCASLSAHNSTDDTCHLQPPKSIQCLFTNIRKTSMSVSISPNCSTVEYDNYMYIVGLYRDGIKLTGSKKYFRCKSESSTSFNSLHPGTRYTVMVQATLYQTGFKSSEIKCGSGNTRPRAPDYLNFTNVEADSFRANWGYFVPDSNEVDSYRLVVETDGRSVDVIISNTSHVVRGLRDGTSYNVSVSSIFGEVESQTRQENVCTRPLPPSNGSVTYQTDRSLTLFFFPPLKSSDTIRITVGGITEYCRDNNCTVGGLQPGRAYNITPKVYSSTCQRWSLPGESFVGFTRPAKPYNLEIADNVTETRLCITWEPPSTGSADKYRVRLKASDNSKDTLTTTSTSQCFGNLTAGTHVTISVRSIWQGFRSIDSSTIKTYTRPLPPVLDIRDVSETSLKVHVQKYNFNSSLACKVYIDSIYRTSISSGHYRNISNLKQGHLYTVNGNCKLGNVTSRRSKSTDVRMLPGQVRYVTVKNRTETSLTIRLQGTPGEYDRFTVDSTCVSPNKGQQNIIRSNDVSASKALTLHSLGPGTLCTLNVTSHIVNLSGRPKRIKVPRTTLEEAPGHVQDLTRSTSSTTEMDITWVSPDIPNGVIRGYTVKMEAPTCTCCTTSTYVLRCNSIYEHGDETCQDIGDLPAATMENKTVTCSQNMFFKATKLTPGRNYTASVSGYTRCWGRPVTVVGSTLETVPSGPPVIKTVSSTETGVHVTWSPPECDHQNGHIAHYMVKYNVPAVGCPGDTTRTSGGHPAYNTIRTQETSLTLDGLVAFQNYSIQVAAATKAGVGPMSPAKHVATKESSPGHVNKTTIKVLDKTDKGITVRWNSPCNPNGNISSYRILVLNVDTGTVDVNSSTSETKLQITTLLPYRNYTVSIAAVNSAGQGPYTNGSLITTNVGEPYPVREFELLSSEGTSITARWNLPRDYTGPSNYTLTVFDEHRNKTVSTTIQGFQHTNYTMGQLKPFWRYKVTIVSLTSAGDSEPVTAYIRTAESVPGRVTNVRLKPETNITCRRAVRISWKVPDVEDRHGVILRYHVRYNDSRQDQGHNYLGNETTKFTIVDVAPGIVHITVTAETSKGEGERNERVTTLEPGAPLKVNESNVLLMKSSDTSVSNDQTQIAIRLPINEFLCNHSNGDAISWGLIVAENSRADDVPFFGLRDDYQKKKYKTWFDIRDSGRADPYIATERKWNPCDPRKQNHHRRRRAVSEDEHVFVVGKDGKCVDKKPPSTCNGELKPGGEYRVRSFVCTETGCTETEYSDSIFTETNNIVPAAIAGVVGTVALTLAIVIVVLFYLSRTRKGCFSPETTVTYSKKPLVDHHDTEMAELSNQTQSPFTPCPVNLVDFPTHVAEMHLDSGLLFSEAYKRLNEQSPTYSVAVAEMQACRPKNRYTNILAFDHSRVKLLPLDDVEGSDYINANYIPGYTSRRAYIATQGPMTSTFDDFWRMVWEQNVDTVVMLTKLVEKGRTKCDKYWPDLGEPVFYGDLVASTQSESNLSDYTIRIIELKLKNNTRTVRHFSYLAWPDMGCPESPSNLLSFVRTVRNDHITDSMSGPFLVHCSAGVGRTGTFIAVDHLLQYIRDQDDVDIYSLVLEMRRHRCKMVQTEDQYVYIHECLKEFITSDDGDQDDESDDPLYENTQEENVYANTQFP